jgi:hypothetical protein
MGHPADTRPLVATFARCDRKLHRSACASVYKIDIVVVSSKGGQAVSTATAVARVDGLYAPKPIVLNASRRLFLQGFYKFLVLYSLAQCEKDQNDRELMRAYLSLFELIVTLS